ncbi:MAG: Rid family detoxifying hydrolase [Anaerolineales bacterium]|nr:Rid family detoxifying hydrolase [Anaerolineales bacterium]
MKREVIASEGAPAAIGPYSQAINAGMFVFASGSLGIDPETGELVPGGVEAQTRQSLKNLSAVLAEAGSSLDQVVKTTVFLADINDYTAVNAVYAEFFAAAPPARSAVQVAALPKAADVEIEVIALTSP